MGFLVGIGNQILDEHLATVCLLSFGRRKGECLLRLTWGMFLERGSTHNLVEEQTLDQQVSESGIRRGRKEL